MAGHGWGKYSYCLRHRHGQVGLTASSALPAVRVQPRAEFLHGAGPLAAVAWFEEVLGQAVGPVRLRGQPPRPSRRLAGVGHRRRRPFPLCLPGWAP